MHQLFATFSLLLCLSVSICQADDWLRFRGQSGNGKTDDALPIAWTPDANVAWKAALPGGGVSSPIVVAGRVFVTCYSGYGLDRETPGEIENLKRHLVCFDASTGEERWQKQFDVVLPEDPYSGIGVTAHGYASHTPVSDGTHVFAYFGKGGAYAFDLDGNQVWHKSLGTESDPWAWGSAASPVVHGDVVIVTASAESQAIVALSKTTGEEVWRQEAAGLDGMWGTPALVKVDDDRTDLVMSVPREMWGLDPDTGKLRWYCEATGSEQAHSSPIVGKGVAFAFTGRGGGSVAVKVGGSGDVTESNVMWTGRDSARFGSPVGHKSHIYLVANGVVTVIEAKSGKKLKQVRLQGASKAGGGGRFGSLDYASPVVANDKLYYLNGKGDMFVFSLGKAPKQLSVNRVTADVESFGGTPAISDGKMYLRSNKHLYCVADSGVEVKPNEVLAKADDDDEQPAGRGGFGGGRGGGGRGGPGGRGGGAGRPGGRGGFDPAAIFTRLDQNKDGKLTSDELTGNPMAERMADLDKDDDKAISKEEFQQGMQAMMRGGGGGPGGGRGGGRGGFGGQKEDSRPKRAQRPAVAD